MNDPKTVLSKIRQSLSLYGRAFIDRATLERIITGCGGGYSPAELAKVGIVSVVKKGGSYFNECSGKTKNPFLVGSVFAKGWQPVFGGLTAYNRYGFTTQIANSYRVYNTGFSGKKTILGTPFEFVKVRQEMLSDYADSSLPDGAFRILTPERAAIEFFREFWKLPELSELNSERLDVTLNAYPLETVARKFRKFLSYERS